MARTARAATALTRDNGVAIGAGTTPDNTNGNTVVSPGPYKAVLMVQNGGGSAITVTVRASGSGASEPTSGYQPFEQAARGDLTISVAAGATTLVPFNDTDRFSQSDNSLSLDFSSSTSVKVWVLQLPYVS